MNDIPLEIADRRGPWKLQDAKARFSEVVRLANEAGPQRVTVNGQEKAVVLSAEDYRRLRGEPTGDALIRLLAEADLDDVQFEHPPTRGPVRAVEL
jgi:antitoxin Phd